MNLFIEFISDNIAMIYILVFAIFLGMEVISKVPAVLHTPLMSGANAISGVVIIGSIILIRHTASENTGVLFIGLIGIALATINVVGGFAVTDRMLHMFKKKRK
jgi:H+-translocating NAD(P) transhydrogenase subunit alpha